LCDFGMSRHIDSRTAMTSNMGTPVYMAPELLKVVVVVVVVVVVIVDNVVVVVVVVVVAGFTH